MFALICLGFRNKTIGPLKAICVSPAGVGGDLLLSLGSGAYSKINLHGLIGLAGPVNTAYWFVEAAPGAANGNGLSGAMTQWSFYLNVAFGLNFPLR